jgi:Fibronectin type III domain
LKKFLFIVFSFLFLFSSVDVHAYSGFLLHTKTMNIGLTVSDISSTSNLATDGNDSTYVSLEYSTGKRYLWYEFSAPKRIDKVYIKYSGIFNLKFYDSAGNEISNLGTASLPSGQVSSINPVDNVKKVAVYENSGVSNIYEFDVYDSTIDLTPPANVASLVATGKGMDFIEVQWQPPTDSDLHEFGVYLDGNFVTRVSKSVNTYRFDSLQYDTPYVVKITSIDSSGNESNGTVLNVRTDHLDSVPPGEISNINTSITDSRVDFSFTLPTDPDFSHIDIYRDGLLLVSNHTSSVFQDTSLVPATTYQYKFVTVDNFGNRSQGLVYSVTTMADTTPPATPTNVNARHGNASAYVSWDPVKDKDLAGYNIYLNGQKVNSSLILSSNYTFTGLNNGTTYTVKVSAVDTSGNDSPLSSAVVFTPSVTGLPIFVLGFDLSDVADSVEEWFSNVWLVVAFSIAVTLAFMISHRIKHLFVN